MEDYWALSMVKINTKKHSTVFVVIKLLSLIAISKLIEILAFIFRFLAMVFLSVTLALIAGYIIEFYNLSGFYYLFLSILIILIVGAAFNTNFTESLIVIIIVWGSQTGPHQCIYVARARITEGANLIAGVKAEISNALAIEKLKATAMAIEKLKATAMAWNAQANGKGATGKYVMSVLIDPNTGAITITFDASTINSTFDYIPKNSTLVFTPYLSTYNTKPQQLALALTQGATGNIDWGCASMSNTVAAGRGFPTIHIGTLPSKYAPSECR